MFHNLFKITCDPVNKSIILVFIRKPIHNFTDKNRGYRIIPDKLWNEISKR